MQVLDTTIANVSLPTIAGNLGVSSDQGTWVITSFAVSNGIAVPLTGWLMGRYGVVRIFVASVLLFTVASFLCGIAWSLPFAHRLPRAAGRSVRADDSRIAGAADLHLPAAQTRHRARHLVDDDLVAPICGPIFGGYISDNFNWGWIFFINVPVGSALRLPLLAQSRGARDADPQACPSTRWVLVLLVIWVGSLQVMLDTGKDADWFASTQIVILALVAAVIVRRLDHLGTDRQAPDRRSVAVQESQFRAGHAGLLPRLRDFLRQHPAAAAVAADAARLHRHLGRAGRRAQRRGRCRADAAERAADARASMRGWTATVAFVVFAISYFMRASFTTDASFGVFVVPLLVQGVAMSTFFVAMLTISLDGVPPQKIPSASGISNFARITAGGFAASHHHDFVGPPRSAAPEPAGGNADTL